jgi:hypothetical protein
VSEVINGVVRNFGFLARIGLNYITRILIRVTLDVLMEKDSIGVVTKIRLTHSFGNLAET